MILITGGLGYIGSHVAVCLSEHGYKHIVLLDNLVNSNLSVLDTLRTLAPNTQFWFYKGDVRDTNLLNTIFQTHPIQLVFHMAALKSVKESFEQHEEYESVNVGGTRKILDVMERFGCKKLVFSSSATVYGSADPPLSENTPAGIGITNPYGETKWTVEQILVARKNSIQSVILRYFNPVGAHSSHLLGEAPTGIPNNLFPVLLRSLMLGNPLNVFGGDWDTPDGTCIRDYIDILDLAEAHVCAAIQFDSLVASENLFLVNIGTGRGTSVLELLQRFSASTGIPVSYTLCSKRDGDIARVVATIDNARISALGWLPRRTLEESCISAWGFACLQKSIVPTN